jgi:diguanylate cyclase (GGDEF)-like protein
MGVLLEPDIKSSVEAALEMWGRLRSERPQDVIPTLEVALARARRTHDVLLIGRVLVALGQGAAVRADGARALLYADEAMELLEPLLPNSSSALVAAYRIIGRVQYDYGNDDLALDVFTKALAICASATERVALQGNIASIQTELGRLEPAIATYTELISTAEALQDLQEVHHLRSNLALALDRLARWQREHQQLGLALQTRARALQEANMALSGAIQDNLKDVQSHVLRTIACMFLEDGLLDRAWDYFEQSLKLARELKSVWNEIHALHSLARIAQDLHDYPRALELAKESLEKAEAVHFQEHASQAHARLAGIFEAMGNFQEALQHERKHFELDNLVKSEASNKRAEALAAQMQLERARLEAKVARERAETLTRLNLQLEQQAMTDGLTGVANRRALSVHLERTHALAKRSGQAFSVVLFDLDHFKLINDLFSHALGDAVLKRIGAILLEQCRKGDFVARYGGEEFALVLMGANNQMTFEICERVRIRIEQEPWQNLEPKLLVTASFGFCTDFGLEKFEAMLNIADQHLYTAKDSGRNRVFPMPPFEL